MTSMTSARPFELLVFDWDGTLMDSIATIVACTREAFVDAGVAAPDEGVIRDTIGLGLRETIDRLAPAGGEDLFERVVSSYRGRWLATYRERQLLFGGVPELLARLAGDGYLLAVATGKSRRGLDHALRSHGLEARFQATRTADEAPSKPHPQMLWDLLDELGVAPESALMIGDSVHDLEMARAAGVAALAVASGAHGRRELESRAPLGCLDAVGELPFWLAAVATSTATP
jgi:phosphoglycolate phosphatase